MEDIEEWVVIDFKARSFRGAARDRLGEWLLDVYQNDSYTGPPSPVESISLLTAADALAACQTALRNGNEAARAILPVGMARSQIQTYKLIKSSQFLFRTAKQKKKKIMTDWKKLTAGTDCGPEILALRKTYNKSLVAVAEAVYRLIRSGKDRLSDLNLNRLLLNASGPGPTHAKNVGVRRKKLSQKFFVGLRAAAPPTGVPATGLALTREQAEQLGLV